MILSRPSCRPFSPGKAFFFGLIALVGIPSVYAVPLIYDETTGASHPLDGTVIMEAENTESDYGEWILNTTTDAADLTGTGAIEFTGNQFTSGPVNSPLEYRFRINKGGIYHLELHCAKLNQNNRTDVANDAYVRLRGRFDASNPDPLDIPNNSLSYDHTYHNDDAPLEVLRSHYKFFGGSNNNYVWQSGSRLDLGGEGNKRRAEYRLYAGEIYTLTISGRSRDFKINRILFRHSGANTGNARDLTSPESSLLAEQDIPQEYLTGAAQDQPLADDTAIDLLDTPVVNGLVTVGGQLKRWHRVDLSLTGPSTSEVATPNPFSDFRMEVIFRHITSGLTYRVPGYFAADGNAENTSATSGDQWRAHLSPDEVGLWSYEIVFREGTDVAIADDATSGTPVAGLNGLTGNFTVQESNKSGFDFRAPDRGRLTYTNEHYLRFAGSGEYFIKAGPDAPENTLAYEDFDDTPNDTKNNGNLRKSWSPHAADYDASDAAFYTWTDPGTSEVQGTELLGALRYLSGEEHLRSFSFLTFNLDGDDDNVFPHLLINGVGAYQNVADNARWDAGVVYHDRFDISKMAQWERIMAYATKRGLLIDLKTQETENDLLLDGGLLGRERKLYYRELIARFGHNLGVTWNLGEEWDLYANDELGDTELTTIKGYTQFFHEMDPYRHLTVVHTYPNGKNSVYPKLIGPAEEPYDPNTSTSSYLGGASLQTNNKSFSNVYGDVSKWVSDSASAGKPWVVFTDEPGDASISLAPDLATTTSQEYGRKNALWGTMMAGGAGANFYFGYQEAESDLTLQDWRSRDEFWDTCRYMLQFFEDNSIPLPDMSPNNALCLDEDSWTLTKTGDVHVIYLKFGGEASVDLTGDFGSYTVHWYDPRTGGALKQNAVTEVAAGGIVSLGAPPIPVNGDWVVLLRNTIPLDVPAITTSSLQDLVVDAAYSFQLQSRGEDTPFEWSVIDGALPAGLSLDADTGLITGVPTGAGVAEFTVQLEDGSGDTYSQEFAVSVFDSAILFRDDFEDDTPLNTTDTGLDLRADVDGSGQDVADVGIEYINQIGDYQIRTNPEPVGNTSSQVLFMNALSGSANDHWVDSLFGASVPIDGLNISFEFYNTTEPGELHGNDSVRFSLIGSDNRATNAEIRLDRDGAFTIDGSNASGATPVVDAWQRFSGTFKATPTVGQYQLEWTLENLETSTSASGTTTVNVNDGDWSANGLVPTVANGIRLRVNDRKNATGYLPYIDNARVEYTAASARPGPIPEILTDTLPNAQLKQPYQLSLEARGLDEPFEWSVASGQLPSGLSLDSSGLISGTPLSEETASFTLEVEDSDGDTSQKAFSLTVVEGFIFFDDFEDDTPLDTTNSGLDLRADSDGAGADLDDKGSAYTSAAGEYQVRSNPESNGNTSSQALFLNQIGGGTQDIQFVTGSFDAASPVDGMKVQFDFYQSIIDGTNLFSDDSVRFYLIGTDGTSANCEIRLNRNGACTIDGSTVAATPVTDAWQRFTGRFSATGTPGQYDLAWTLTNLETNAEATGTTTVNLNDGEWAANTLDTSVAGGIRLYVFDKKNGNDYQAYFDNVGVSYESGVTVDHYAAWMANYPTLVGDDALPDAYPNNSRLSNLENYAFGGDPRDPLDDSGITPVMQIVEGSIPESVGMTYTYLERKDALSVGLLYIVEYSEDLSGWMTEDVTEIDRVEVDSEYDQVTVSVPESSSTKQFMRIRVEL